MSIVIVVGGSSSVVVVKSLVSVLVEFVAKSEDWSTRKAAAEGLEKLAVVYRDLLLEFKASCLKTFEVKRFDKLGVDTVPVFVGPVSYLWLSKPAKDVEKTFDMLSLLDKILSIYNEGIAELKEAGATWIQFDEATLVKDLEAYQLEAFTKTYSALESACSGLNVIVATYFADVPAEAVKTLTSLPGVSGYTFDLVRGEKTLGLIKNSFPSGKYLFAGLFDGRNIWANDLAGSVAVLESLEGVVGKDSGHSLVRGKRNIRLLKLLKLIVMEDIQQKCHK